MYKGKKLNSVATDVFYVASSVFIIMQRKDHDIA